MSTLCKGFLVVFCMSSTIIFVVSIVGQLSVLSKMSSSHQKSSTEGGFKTSSIKTSTFLSLFFSFATSLTP